MPSTVPDELDSITHWYFAVGGLQTHQARLEVNRAISLRRLVNFPRPDELAVSLRDLPTAGCMAHYGEALVQHELIFDAGYFDEYEQIIQTAGLVMGALRIRTGADVFCPAVCERSWASLGGVTGNGCRTNRVEQVMRTHAFDTSYLVTPEDLEWVGQKLGPLTLLMADDRFATAVEALCSYLHAGNYRMMAAQLWAGVEALFDVRANASNSASIIGQSLIWTSEQPYDSSDFRPLSGGTHGCYYSRGLDQEILPSPPRSSRRRTDAPFVNRHRRHRYLRRDRRR